MRNSTQINFLYDMITLRQPFFYFNLILINKWYNIKNLYEVRGMRVLVVEDERDLNRVICKKLKVEGYSVDACYDGEEALLYIDGELPMILF